MITPLLRTKFYIPPVRPELVSRPYLIGKLNGGLNRKLTLLSAPAGFGKTTLLSEWIATTDRLVTWVSLDESDDDPTQFWIYVISALQSTGDDLGQAALEMLNTSQPPPMEILLASLINEIDHTTQSFVLVLDDFHVINQQGIHDALTFFIENLPKQVHLILSTRADPPWPMARLRARGEMNELRTDNLRFTLEEVTTFLNNMMEGELSAGDISALDARIEGWAAGLQMVAISMQGREDLSGFIQGITGTHHFILDYLVEEVLEQQSPDLQTFLLKTSILERMTADLCDAVSGRNDSQDILTGLHRRNMFILSLDEERRWYRFHPLFADLLRNRLGHTLPDEVTGLHHRASAWYEEHEFIEEAITHAFEGVDYQQAAHLVERSAMPLIVQGKLTTLSRWIDALPEGLVRERPRLCVYLAWIRYWLGFRAQGEECLQYAEEALAKSSLPGEEEVQPDGPPPITKAEKQHITGRISAIRAFYALTNEDLPLANKLSLNAFELLPEGDYMRILVALVLGGAYAGQGNTFAAEKTYAQAFASAHEHGYMSLAVSAGTYLGMQQVKQGRLREAFGTYRKAVEMAATPGGQRLLAAGFPYAKLSGLYCEWNELENASQCVVEGVELSTMWGQADILADANAALAGYQLAQWDLSRAIETLQETDELAQRTKVDPDIKTRLDDVRIRLWLKAGNLDAAVRWAQTSGLEVDGELSYQHELNHINLARVLVAQGALEPSGPYLEDALGLLDRLFAAADSAGWVHEVIRIRVLQALTLQAQDRGEDAQTMLALALSLAEPEGYLRTFIDEGEPMLSLLLDAAGRGDTAAYAGGLLAALEGEITGEVPPSTIQLAPLVEPLSEREMEVLRLLATSLPTSEIAHELSITVSTLRTHTKSIYGKLDVHSRIEAVERGREIGLL
jgi:LuxR family maltose regulon positive regulatory protein